MKWYEADPGRLEIEKRLLARYHRDAKLVIRSGKMRVVKLLRTRRNTYSIEGVFADEHPYSAMQFYVRKPRLKNSPTHMYDSQYLCLHLPEDVGPETTAKIYLDWAIQWVRMYERWLNGEEWPETNRG